MNRANCEKIEINRKTNEGRVSSENKQINSEKKEMN